MQSPQPMQNIHNVVLTTSFSQRLSHNVFLTTSFSHRCPYIFVHTYVHNVFLTTSFSQRLFHNVFLTTSFSHRCFYIFFRTTKSSQRHNIRVIFVCCTNIPKYLKFRPRYFDNFWSIKLKPLRCTFTIYILSLC